jgi:hypothetical protein
MNTLPTDIIITELFPKLKISDIIKLTHVHPKWLDMTKKYILSLNNSLGFKDIHTHLDVLSKLTVNLNVRTEFNQIKQFSPVTVKLLTQGYYNHNYPIEEEELLKMLESLYPYFEEDMNSNLDTIFSKKIVNPSTIQFIKKNSLKGILSCDTDFRILHHLFPNFERELDDIIRFFCKEYQIDPEGIIYSFKTEINRKLYRLFPMFTFKNFYFKKE